MQTQTESGTSLTGNETRIDVQTIAGDWQSPEAVELHPAFLPGPPPAFVCHPVLLERGVPYSPLND